jgi:hypothetical protein
VNGKVFVQGRAPERLREAPLVMSDLIIITGPPAAGKAAVGHELAKLTGFRFFHNHMTAEPVAALFGWGTELTGEVTAEVRLLLFSKALAQTTASPIIFTFVWCFDDPSDTRFIAQLVQLFESRGSRVYFVELLASLQARLSREGTALRLSLKPSKQDIAFARSLHIEAYGKYQMNSNGNFPYPARHLVIDTECHTPQEAARLVAEHFGFGYAGG